MAGPEVAGVEPRAATLSKAKPRRARPEAEEACMRLRQLAARKMRFYFSAPAALCAEDPERWDGVLASLRAIVGTEATIVQPDRKLTGGRRKDWGIRRPEDPGGVLVVVPRPDLTLGSGSAREYRAWRTAGRPVFVLTDGGVTASRQFRWTKIPQEEATPRVWARLVPQVDSRSEGAEALEMTKGVAV